jgi:SAM-dependent methyltransferase
MPRVPGMDAFLDPAAVPSSAKRTSTPPAVSPVDDVETDTGWATPVPPLASSALLDRPSAPQSAPPSDPVAARRKSRRVVKGPDDSSPKESFITEAADGFLPPSHRDESPPARARSSSAPWLDGFPDKPSDRVAPIQADSYAGSVAVLDTSDDIIQPMRIISIGTDSPLPSPAVTPSSPAPTPSSPAPAPPPPVPTLPPLAATLLSPLPVPSKPAPRAPVDVVVEEVDALDDDESGVSSVRAAADSRPEEIEALEEIELERISDTSNPTLEAVAPGPKKPPPPPPKRSTTLDPSAPPATPPPPSAVAAFSASAPISNPPGAAPPASSPAPAAAAPPPPPSLDAPRKRAKPWWEELFGDDYLRTMDKVEAKVIRKDCDFIEDRLGLEKGAVMLDLACGPGAHAVELASRGYSVVGYDLSLAMLARAADEAQERAQKLNFLQGDMREMAFEDTFDGVYCWQTSFGYFDDEKNVNVLERIHRSLRKGGMLLLDVINHDYVAPRQPSLVWFEGDGCVCMDEMSVDFFTSRLRVKRTVMFEDGRARELDYAIRLYALHELGKMLHECGFKVIEVTGHPAHPGVFFGSESPRVIVLAERSERE